MIGLFMKHQLCWVCKMFIHNCQIREIDLRQENVQTLLYSHIQRMAFEHILQSYHMSGGTY